MKLPATFPGVFAQTLIFKGATFCKRCGADCYPVFYMVKLTHRKGTCLKCQQGIADGGGAKKKKGAGT